MHLLLAWAMTRFPSSSHEYYHTVDVQASNEDWRTTAAFPAIAFLGVGIWVFLCHISWRLVTSDRSGVCEIERKKTSEGEHEQFVGCIGAHFGAFNSTWKDEKACNSASPLSRDTKLTENQTEMKYCGKCVELERCLLPPRQVGVAADSLTVVLDLDDTLIMTRKTNDIPGKVAEAIRNGTLMSKKSVWNFGQGETSMTIVFRPGVQNFIQKLSEFAEVVVFTAGSASYAGPLIDKLDPDHSLFSARLFRCSTVKTRYQEYVKDLSLLGRSLQRVILVDDKPLSGLLQPHNLLPCMPFTGDYRDHQLMASYLPLLEHLHHAPDVRPVLKDIFQMESYLIDWGVQENFLKRCLDNPGDTRHSRLR